MAVLPTHSSQPMSDHRREFSSEKLMIPENEMMNNEWMNAVLKAELFN